MCYLSLLNLKATPILIPERIEQETTTVMIIRIKRRSLWYIEGSQAIYLPLGLSYVKSRDLEIIIYNLSVCTTVISSIDSLWKKITSTICPTCSVCVSVEHFPLHCNWYSRPHSLYFGLTLSNLYPKTFSTLETTSCNSCPVPIICLIYICVTMPILINCLGANRLETSGRYFEKI